ncbi:hypothetical protein [Streptomyces sp. NPDC127098]|uniref:hypothetical protein n=1 Tax=Streptomyces sp. NPDC127098 TaxID=3347137 RepID=UPI00365E118A
MRVVFVDRPPYRITAARESGVVRSYAGSNLFVCLTKLRKDLDAEGLLLCCQGARADVTLSGMEAQMTGGRFVYTFTPGARRVNQETVDIFAPAPAGIVVGPAEQRAAILAFHGLPDTGWEPE